MSPRRLAMLTALLAVAALAGCGGDRSPDSLQGAEVTPPATATTPTTTAETTTTTPAAE